MRARHDRVVLVTGAAGNLGRAVARSFAESGDRLVLVDRSATRLPHLFADLADDRRHLLAGAVDLRDPDSVQAVVDQAIARLGRLDVLVHTVGGFLGGKPVHETSLEDWDQMQSVNARSAFVVSRAVLPRMLEQSSGRILLIAARPGLAGKAGMGAYSAAKAAVLRLTESLSAETREAGINVNCIVPGTIDTPENRQAMPEADFARWVTPESLAGVIVFLASDAARDIHGAAIPVFGQS